MSDSYRLEEQLFAEAVALPFADRAEFLRRACGGDRELQARVEALVREHETGGDFLETPPERELATAARQASEGGAPEAPGSQVGRYRLIETIGEGGCGVVYRAEQIEPVRREVALKVIKLGMDTKAVIARFEAERQALALMDHPNIARALDAGATETGRPFFVMELVHGTRITTFCDERRLSIAQRLSLFIQVCSAVQHAHQKGVIHRDLKPSNILVTSVDDVAVPKVIDFGIAKATQGRLADETLFTAFEQFIGTPAYMSPEQAELSAADIDTRSDIYSLGVLLYELLTGRTPLEAEELRRAGVDEVRRRIREQETPRPSARLRTLEAARLTTAAAHRQIEPPKLVHLVNGDLDWIAMRCLEKDRTRRYETANALARDVDRYLGNEPVSARPPGSAYLLGRFVRRHRLAVTAASAIAATIVAGLAVSTTSLFREKAARELAEVEKRKAETEVARSAQFARFMEDMLKGVGPSVARGRDTTLMREILDATAQRLDRELGNQPALQASMRETLGDVYFALGEHARAEEMRRAVLAADRRLYGDDDLVVAHALDKLGDDLTLEGKPAEAEKCHREALAIERTKLGRDDRAIAATLVSLADSILAQSLAPLNRTPEAEALVREALQIERKDGGVAEVRTLTILGAVFLHTHSYADAETVFREALVRDPENETILSQLARALSFTHKLPEAATTLRRVLEIQLARLNEGNPKIGITRNELANALRRSGNLPEAESVGRDAVALRRKLLAREPANKDFERSLAQSLNELGYALYREGKFAEAERVDREALALHEAAVGNVNREGVDCLHRVGDDLLAQEKLDEAETWLRSTLKVEEETLDEHVAISIRQIVGILRRQHRPTADDPCWSEAVAAAQATLESKNPMGTAYVGGLGAELLANGKYTEAEPLVRRHLERLERQRPDDWYVFTFRYQLGAVLAGQRKFAEAEPLLRVGFAGLEERRWRDIPTRSHFQLLYAARFLVKLYTDWGKPSVAAEWDHKLTELLAGFGQ